MSDKSTERMLLSHNFSLYNNELPAFNREEFARVFIEGLQEKEEIECGQIQNPHWIVEIIFPAELEAREIGRMCGEILIDKRKSQKADSKLTTDTLILGGKKSTPASNISPSSTSLKFGEWGVDIVETIEASVFLRDLGWEKMVDSKPSDDIFKIEFLKD